KALRRIRILETAARIEPTKPKTAIHAEYRATAKVINKDVDADAIDARPSFSIPFITVNTPIAIPMIDAVTNQLLFFTTRYNCSCGVGGAVFDSSLASPRPSKIAQEVANNIITEISIIFKIMILTFLH
ncbi:MAG: hypothetical protein ACTSPB_16875, partial [Candidatus Thorarchaeota archaeon]